tara:strand:- start:16 stop:606 length:591 start_codon:yes stop_codon:yes gene_type:complete
MEILLILMSAAAIVGLLIGLINRNVLRGILGGLAGLVIGVITGSLLVNVLDDLIKRGPLTSSEVYSQTINGIVALLGYCLLTTIVFSWLLSKPKKTSVRQADGQEASTDSLVRDFEPVPIHALNRFYAASFFDVVGIDAHSESWSRRNLQHPVLTLQSRGVALYGYAACALELLVSSGVLHIRREMKCVEVTKSGS